MIRLTSPPRATLRRGGPLLLGALLPCSLLFGCGASAPARQPDPALAAPPALAQLQHPTFVFDDPATPVLPPDRARDWRDEVIYLVMPDRFFDGDPANNRDVDRADKGKFHGGDWLGLQRKLGYLSQLGITALWITPVVRQIDHPVTGAGFPDYPYHGYWAEDFTTVEPRLGTEAELRSLVQAAHGLGIKVLLDVVLNHPGYGSRFVQDGRMVRSTELGTCQESGDDLTNCLLGLPDFRTEDPTVAAQLITWQMDWIARTGCDGFRVDTVKHVDHEVWREFRRRIHAAHPGFFLLGEVWGALQHEEYASEFMGDQMDTLFDFGFNGEVEGFVLGRGRPVAFARYLANRHKFPARLPLAHYLDSHDVPTFLHRLQGDTSKAVLAAVLQLTSLGIPVITWGNEVGRRGGEWPHNRSHMLWGEEQDQGLLSTYRKLIAIRKAHPALSRGGFVSLHTGEHALVYLREAAEGEDRVIVALNRGEQDAPVELQLTAAAAAVTRWQELFLDAGSALAATDGKLTLTIPAGGARIRAAP